MAVHKIRNETNSPILFAKLEDTRDNEILQPGKSSDAYVWMPHVDNQKEFYTKTVVVTDLRTAKVIAYAWEHKGTYRHMVEMPGSFKPDAANLPGASKGDIELVIDANGRLRGDSARSAKDDSSDSAKDDSGD